MAMATPRNIMRGTFRLSVAVAALAAVYGFYEQMAAFAEANAQSLKMVYTLECGAQLPEETLKSAVNQYGLIDLGKVGCANERFLARSSELLEARNGVMRREWIEWKFDVRYAAECSLVYALPTLIVVNLLGFAFAGLRAMFDWIASGYRPAP